MPSCSIAAIFCTLLIQFSLHHHIIGILVRLVLSREDAMTAVREQAPHYFMNIIVVMVVLAFRHGQGRTARDRHIRDFGTMVIRSRLAQACLHVLLDVF